MCCAKFVCLYHHGTHPGLSDSVRVQEPEATLPFVVYLAKEKSFAPDLVTLHFPTGWLSGQTMFFRIPPNVPETSFLPPEKALFPGAFRGKRVSADVNCQRCNNRISLFLLFQFFISALSFATFAVSPELPQNRLQLSFTLLLTSVAFKFVINQSLPKISYLTYMVSRLQHGIR